MTLTQKSKGIYVDDSFDPTKFDSIIFDCDGVLVDITNSYDQTIVKTAKYVLETLAKINDSIKIDFKIIEILLKLYPNNVVGLKDSSGDSDRMMKVIKYFNDFAVFCGHDSLALNICKRGGAGAITAGTNVCGKLLSFILKNHKNVHYIGKKDPMNWLQENHKDFSILITQGAGTISKLNKKIQKKWQ